jgi:hypothetical protein
MSALSGMNTFGILLPVVVVGIVDVSDEWDDGDTEVDDDATGVGTEGRFGVFGSSYLTSFTYNPPVPISRLADPTESTSPYPAASLCTGVCRSSVLESLVTRLSEPTAASTSRALSPVKADEVEKKICVVRLARFTPAAEGNGRERVNSVQPGQTDSQRKGSGAAQLADEYMTEQPIAQPQTKKPMQR